TFRKYGFRFVRSIEVYDPSPGLAGDEAGIIAAAGGGVFSNPLISGGWTARGKGLPRGSFTDIHVPYRPDRMDNNPDDDFAYVSSFGRGAWKLPSLGAAMSIGAVDIQGTGANETVTVRLNPARTEVEVLEGATLRGSAPLGRVIGITFFSRTGE